MAEDSSADGPCGGEGNALALSQRDERVVMLAVDHDPLAGLLFSSFRLGLAWVEDRAWRVRNARRMGELIQKPLESALEARYVIERTRIDRHEQLVVAGEPSGAIAQPTGMVSPLLAATSIRPRGTVEVAMSRTSIPNRPAGAAKAIGFVPSKEVRARVGATIGEVLVRLKPINPCRATRIAYQPAIP